MDDLSARKRKKSGRTGCVVLAVLFFAWSAIGGSGCKRKDPAGPSEPDGSVPAPLKNPAGFCFATCGRRVRCRLGSGEGEEQVKILKAELDRCSRNCLEWIKGHPYDAVALRLCYAKPGCNDLMACLGYVQRLLKVAADPEKKRQCFKLCVDYGQCEGNERACIRSCTAGDLRLYRALEACENRGCPQVRECVDRHRKKISLQ